MFPAMVSQSAAPVIGSVFEGRYRVVSLIGRGGMGDVYLGEDTRLRRRCALKVLHAALAEDRTNVERFLREAQMIASLEHRNIVDIYAYGEEPSGLIFFAMELLTGEDLDARLKHRAERPFAVHDACVWAVQIAQAVAVVHDAGLIHRDLKTSNVFLAQRRDGEEICKLLDFGIARAEDSSDLTRTGVALGTPNYMSPEQIRNVDVDRRSDIYSFGVLLFKLLTGKALFSGEAIQVAMQHCSTPPRAPSTVAPAAGISAALDAIVLTCLAKEPGDRFQSMRDVEAALTAVLRDEAPDLAPVTRVTRAPQGYQTGPVLAASQATASPPDAITSDSTPLQTGQTEAVPAEPPAPAASRRSLALIGGIFVGLVTIAVIVLAPAPHPPIEPVVGSAETPQVALRKPEVAPIAPIIEPRVEPAAEPEDIEPPPEFDEPEVLPPLEPEVPPPEPEPPARQAKASPQLADPLKQIARKAQKCRKTRKLVDGPKITIDYAIGIDGKVTRSIPSVHDDLGRCLAAAVLSTQFEPKLILGRKLSL